MTSNTDPKRGTVRLVNQNPDTTCAFCLKHIPVGTEYEEDFVRCCKGCGDEMTKKDPALALAMEITLVGKEKALKVLIDLGIENPESFWEPALSLIENGLDSALGING